MDERETPLRGGRTIPAIVRIEDSVHRPVGPRSAFVHQRKGFPVRHDFSGLTHRAERYFSFLPGEVPAEVGSFLHARLVAVARAFYTNFTTPAAGCELTNGSSRILTS